MKVPRLQHLGERAATISQHLIDVRRAEVRRVIEQWPRLNALINNRSGGGQLSHLLDNEEEASADAAS